MQFNSYNIESFILLLKLQSEILMDFGKNLGIKKDGQRAKE